MPAFNCEKYISKCINSLLRQTLTEIEIIVVHHDSIDGSLDVLKQYSITYPQIVLKDYMGISLSDARNIGLEAARGEYIGFVDADDFIEHDMFERLYYRATETESDIVACDYAMTYSEHEEISVLNMEDTTIGVEELGTEIFYLRYLARNPNIWNKIYRRSLITRHKIRFEIDNGEDLLFNIRLLPYLNKISTISDSLYHYVQRKNSLMHDSMTQYSATSLNLLSCYSATSQKMDIGTENLPYFVFANMFTGFMFSPHCIGMPRAFFRTQIDTMRESEIFDDFCKKIMNTNELVLLYREGAMTKRFYWTQKFLFALCHFRLYRLAAFFMWFASRFIVLKKRKLQFHLFD